MKLTLTQAARMLKAGEIVAVPTETVYGLAVSIRHPGSIGRVFKLKGRPADNPLIVHIGSFADLDKLTRDVPPFFFRLKKLWPGPLTVIFKANLKSVPVSVRARLKTVAIRMPSHPMMLRLLKKTGPLAAPSANLSGKPSPTRAKHVWHDFGRDFPVLDGGACRHGVESTVVLLEKNSWQILRPGSITQETIEKNLQCPPKKEKIHRKLISPGQKYRHYAPAAKLTLCFKKNEFALRQKRKIFDAVLGFSDTKTGKILMSLGKRNDFKTNLRRLFFTLRKLDEKGFQNVLVDGDFGFKGLGRTLKERLLKAGG